MAARKPRRCARSRLANKKTAWPVGHALTEPMPRCGGMPSRKNRITASAFEFQFQGFPRPIARGTEERVGEQDGRSLYFRGLSRVRGVAVLRQLFRQKRSGMLFAATDSNQMARIEFQQGNISDVNFMHKRGSVALTLLTRIQADERDFRGTC